MSERTLSAKIYDWQQKNPEANWNQFKTTSGIKCHESYFNKIKNGKIVPSGIVAKKKPTVTYKRKNGKVSIAQRVRNFFEKYGTDMTWLEFKKMSKIKTHNTVFYRIKSQMNGTAKKNKVAPTTTTATKTTKRTYRRNGGLAKVILRQEIEDAETIEIAKSVAETICTEAGIKSEVIETTNPDGIIVMFT